MGHKVFENPHFNVQFLLVLCSVCSVILKWFSGGGCSLFLLGFLCFSYLKDKTRAEKLRENKKNK